MNNTNSGVTTNMSEGFNNIIKCVNDHKKLPVDNMVLSHFFTECIILRDIKRKGEFRELHVEGRISFCRIRAFGFKIST